MFQDAQTGTGCGPFQSVGVRFREQDHALGVNNGGVDQEAISAWLDRRSTGHSRGTGIVQCLRGDHRQDQPATGERRRGHHHIACCGESDAVADTVEKFLLEITLESDRLPPDDPPINQL